jgi:hypothetical protein
MTCRTNSFTRPTFQFRSALFAAILASGIFNLYSQSPPKQTDPFQKISFKPDRSCTVPAAGEVTALVKNGVELSTSDDYDCDGVPDAYDNCVGMPNPNQADTNRNVIGDVCEAAVTIKTNAFAKPATKKSRDNRRNDSEQKKREAKSKRRIGAHLNNKRHRHH